MAVSKEMQEELQNFERLRQQLMMVSNQKQQVEFQLNITNEAIDELKESKEEKVFKAVGNILILTPKSKVSKELSANKEELDIRLESLKKQETSFIDRLNKLKSKIEDAAKPADEKKSKSN